MPEPLAAAYRWLPGRMDSTYHSRPPEKGNQEAVLVQALSTYYLLSLALADAGCSTSTILANPQQSPSEASQQGKNPAFLTRLGPGGLLMSILSARPRTSPPSRCWRLTNDASRLKSHPPPVRGGRVRPSLESKQPTNGCSNVAIEILHLDMAVWGNIHLCLVVWFPRKVELE